MSETKELKFVKLRGHEDLIGYVSMYKKHIIIERPLRVEIDTFYEENRQLLSLQEYLPQSIVSSQEIEIQLDDIMFTLPVRTEFVEQYQQVSEFFYDIQNKSKLKKEVDETSIEKAQKVVSILEALTNKKGKPVH